MITSDSIKHLAKNNSNLEKLVLDGCCRIGDLWELGIFTKKLKHLSLNDCMNSRPRNIQMIVGGCPDLEYLSLNRCGRVRSKDVEALAAFCPKLKHLDITIPKVRPDVYDPNRPTEKSIKLVAEFCPDLKYLAIRNIIGV